jgi:hypothetical protein
VDEPRTGLCTRCGERPADPAETPRLFLLLSTLFLFGSPTSRPFDWRLCRECAGGFHFLGLLLLAAFVVGAYVLTIVLLG